jgi:glycosyltransferase involved in cell wall biosynthesis
MANNVSRIAIITFWEFPEGMAPTTRIISYGKGLLKVGVGVDIYIFKRNYSKRKYLGEEENKPEWHYVEGLRYRYFHFFPRIAKRFFFLRVIFETFSRLKLLLSFNKDNRNRRYDAIFFSFDDVFSLRAYTTLFRYYNIPKLLVADEFPLPIRSGESSEIPNKLKLQYQKLHAILSGRILMSENLRAFYDSTISIKPSFILNTVFDADRFKPSKKEEQSEGDKFHICYMGNLDLEKDNVDNIIRAVRLLPLQQNRFELCLYGVPSRRDEEFLKRLIIDLDLENCVKLMGRATYEDVPKILMRSDILVSSQPDSIRAQGGFPTKLGEYLLSGRPSVFTRSSGISDYVNNREHLYLVEPEKPEEYAATLKEIIENYEIAKEIGEKGRNYIISEYDSELQAEKLVKFIRDF